MNLNTREIIYNILYEIDKNNAFSNISINRNIEKNTTKLDESFIREVVYGVLENRLYIDYIIKQFSKIKINKISLKITTILRIGIYQIIFMDKVPDRAAVNECVNLTKKISHKGTHGYVNGVLRTISRNKNDIKLPSKSKDYSNYLSIKYSHPKWMVDRWIKEFGTEFTKDLLVANNEKPLLNIRVNTLKTTREKLLEIFIKNGFEVTKTKYSNDGIIIHNPFRITEMDEYKNGSFTIQDESSMLVAEVMNPKEGSIVIDLCSAPGGKATHIAQKMKNIGKIISRDIYEHKLKLINENSSRLGIDIIETEKFDALKFDDDLFQKADYCLVDAPCSGLGIIRRKPDIKWNKSVEDIEEIKQIQYNILLNGSKYLKKEGILVYSTCTIEKDENINLVNRFISENNDFDLCSIDYFSNEFETFDKGYIELFPNINDTDGFFIAKMIKK